MTWMTCGNCGNCGCTTYGCPEGAVSGDDEAPCTADQLARCQAGWVEGGTCVIDPGQCKSFAEIPCAAAFGVQEALPSLSTGDEPAVPPEFANTDTFCSSPAALFCVSPESGFAECKNCAVNATGNLQCPESCDPSPETVRACVPMIGCLNCADPGDASRGPGVKMYKFKDAPPGEIAPSDTVCADKRGATGAVRCCAENGATCESPDCSLAAVSHTAASAKCDALSMRLCTEAEQLALCGGTGCSFDHEYVWTSDECTLPLPPALPPPCENTKSASWCAEKDCTKDKIANEKCRAHCGTCTP